MRFFNTEGPVRPDIHYTLPPLSRWDLAEVLELIDQLTRLLDRPLDPIFEAARLGDVRESQADITQARLRLGFDPGVDIAQGLRTSIDYYRQQATGKGPALS